MRRTRAVLLTAASNAGLRSMHWETAGHVMRALERFAATGEGPVRRFTQESGPTRYKLRVAPYDALLSVTPDAVIVWRIERYA